MQKILMSLLLLSSTILAEVTNVEISRDYIENNKIKIIDIRTQSEWEKMGVIKGAYLITFFPEDATYNPKLFLQELNRVIDKDEQFALISNTASRTKLVSNFLGKKNTYNVVNLIGGMTKLIKEGYKVEAYDPNKKREIKKKVEIKEAVDNEALKTKKMKSTKIETEKMKKEVTAIEKKKTMVSKDTNSTTT
jgi:rhodanese-related sulfurtransferase